MVTVEEIKVVIAVNKRDLWFCRICVASIRYYYTNIEIYLIKDELNGQFSTKEIEKKWNVDVIEFDKQKFGWSAAKMFLYTDPRFWGKYLFVLDSDIVFVGKLIDFLSTVCNDSDVVVSVEREDNPHAEYVKNVYFDVEKIINFDLDYSYPGYFFNAGQLLVKGGFIRRNDIDEHFDFGKFPYWKNLSLLPLVDQSLFNYIFPVLQKRKKLSVNSSYKYMIWSNTDLVKNMRISELGNDLTQPYLIHWAGEVRTPFLSKMNGSSVLRFFEDYYYQKISFGFAVRVVRRYLYVLEMFVLRVQKKVNLN
jgi:hypothetical protein